MIQRGRRCVSQRDSAGDGCRRNMESHAVRKHVLLLHWVRRLQRWRGEHVAHECTDGRQRERRRSSVCRRCDHRRRRHRRDVRAARDRQIWRLLVAVSPRVVLLQRLVVHELVVADLALVVVGHVLGVSALDVRAQTGEVRERVAAMLADVRPLPHVLVDVVLERVLEVIRLHAVRALKFPVYCPLEIRRSRQRWHHRRRRDAGGDKGGRRRGALVELCQRGVRRRHEAVRELAVIDERGGHRGQTHGRELGEQRRWWRHHRGDSRWHCFSSGDVDLPFDDRHVRSHVLQIVVLVDELRRSWRWYRDGGGLFGHIPSLFCQFMLVTTSLLHGCVRLDLRWSAVSVDFRIFIRGCLDLLRRTICRRHILAVTPRDVLLQRLSIQEAILTNIALELQRHLTVVAALDVHAQAREVRERAVTVLAHVRLAAGVRVDVILQAVLEVVLLGAERARVLAAGPVHRQQGLVDSLQSHWNVLSLRKSETYATIGWITIDFTTIAQMVSRLLHNLFLDHRTDDFLTTKQMIPRLMISQLLHVQVYVISFTTITNYFTTGAQMILQLAPKWFHNYLITHMISQLPHKWFHNNITIDFAITTKMILQISHNWFHNNHTNGFPTIAQLITQLPHKWFNDFHANYIATICTHDFTTISSIAHVIPHLLHKWFYNCRTNDFTIVAQYQ